MLRANWILAQVCAVERKQLEKIISDYTRVIDEMQAKVDESNKMNYCLSEASNFEPTTDDNSVPPVADATDDAVVGYGTIIGFIVLVSFCILGLLIKRK